MTHTHFKRFNRVAIKCVLVCTNELCDSHGDKKTLIILNQNTAAASDVHTCVCVRESHCAAVDWKS